MSPANVRLVDRVGRLIAEGPGGAGTDRPPLIAIVGAQGCGKTTLARAAANRFGAAQISIDDVYLTRAERELLARDVHPLFVTRGPPGTHDLVLLQGLIDALSAAGPQDRSPIPDFDKRGDDRRPIADWRVFTGRPSAILIDAWCLGAVAEDAAALARPVNALEQAKQAAADICGRPAPTPEVPWFWSDQYDLKLQIAGVAFDADALVVRGDPAAAKFAVFHLRGDRLLAVEAVNAAPEFMMGKTLIASGQPISREKLADPAVSMKNVAA